jgi:hypothetical protein
LFFFEILMGTYFLANELGCCLCNSADSLPACNAATACSDGYSQKIFAENIPCAKITATTACPTWHAMEPVSVSGNLTITEISSGHCFCMGFSDDGSTGSVTRTMEIQSTAVTLNGGVVEFSCTSEVTIEGTCDGDDVGSFTSSVITAGFQIAEMGLCCQGTPGLCTQSLISAAKIPDELPVCGEPGYVSVVGDCLTEKGYTSCLNSDDVNCNTSGCHPLTFSPDISASFNVIIQNRYGETIASKQIFPQQFACPLFVGPAGCCHCVGDFDFSYSYNWTLSGTAYFKVGNE